MAFFYPGGTYFRSAGLLTCRTLRSTLMRAFRSCAVASRPALQRCALVRETWNHNFTLRCLLLLCGFLVITLFCRYYRAYAGNFLSRALPRMRPFLPYSKLSARKNKSGCLFSYAAHASRVRVPPTLDFHYHCKLPFCLQALGRRLPSLFLFFTPLMTRAETLVSLPSFIPYSLHIPATRTAFWKKTAVFPSVAASPPFAAGLGPGRPAMAGYLNDLPRHVHKHTYTDECLHSPGSGRCLGHVAALLLREAARKFAGSTTPFLPWKSRSDQLFFIALLCSYLKEPTLGTRFHPLRQTPPPTHPPFSCAFSPARAGQPTSSHALLGSLISLVSQDTIHWGSRRSKAHRLRAATSVTASKQWLPFIRVVDNAACRYRAAAKEAHGISVAISTAKQSFLGSSTAAGSRAQALLEDIKKLTIVEVAELVQLIEQAFGVPAARAAQYAESTGQQGKEAENEAKQAKPAEKKTYSVEIKSVPLEKRIGVIKTLRTVRPDLGLKDAKGVIDALPNTVLKNISKEKAEEAQKILVDAGAKVELK